MAAGIVTSSAAALFEGGDTLSGALATIHDQHLNIINNREGELRHHLTFWLSSTLDQISRSDIGFQF